MTFLKLVTVRAIMQIVNVNIQGNDRDHLCSSAGNVQVELMNVLDAEDRREEERMMTKWKRNNTKTGIPKRSKFICK